MRTKTKNKTKIHTFWFHAFNMRISLLSCFFFNLYIVTFFSIASILVSSQCQNDQKELLLGLKNSLNSSIPGKIENWNQTTDCCFWEGITCDAGGRVIELDLSNTLEGQVPAEISRLTNLVSLDLSESLFFSSRPLKLENPNLKMLVQNLTRLRSLRLDGVNISATGNDWCKGLSLLTNLEVLSMSNCNLSGPIDGSLKNLKNLSIVHLDGNNLSAVVPSFFARFPNLTSLKLSSCGLHGEFPREILQVRTLQSLEIPDNAKLHGSLPEFHDHVSLTKLALSRTKFNGSIPKSIGNLVNLTTLDLSYCGFDGAIPRSVSNLHQLVLLDLSFNNFTGQVPPLDMSKNLAYLDLSYNALTGKIESYKWEELRSLTYIDLSLNSLRGSIPSSLVALPSLKKLLLSNNHFDGEVLGFAKVGESLLDTIDLSGNKLQGQIPTYVFELSRLSVLLLSSNKFNGTIRLRDIQKLVNLTYLDLSHNNLYVDAAWSYFALSSIWKLTTLKLASCKLKEFPALVNQSRLTYLDLSQNQISGEVPSWIWNVSGILQYLNLSSNRLEGLQKPYRITLSLSVLDLHANKLSGNIPALPSSASYLDFSSNNFTSSLPENIGNNLSYTIFFSISSNNFRGSIPKSICDAAYLQVLDLSKNSLSGEIPNCLIEKIDSLGVLNLRGNNLSGKIPDAFPINCSIQTLDVNGNELEGTIPRSHHRCKELEVLNLGNNHIKDSFPCHLKNITSLRILSLRSNKFHGGISCLANRGAWSKLQIVDIANNSFNGTLSSKILTTWRTMMVVDKEAQSNVKHLQFGVFLLSGLNYIDGITVTNKGLTMELVKILTIFTSIDFSSNKFEGPIPDVIGELKALYFLNLSHNALTGNIPPFLGNLQQLESLDLSSNKLSGSIPQQLVDLTFLEVLNLSHNQLEGSIPAGKQFATFSNDSYEGNKGLCGYPLTKNCKEANHGQDSKSGTGNHIDWNLISVEIGFVFGLGVAILPLMFWKKWRVWYYKRTDHVLYQFFPKLDRRNRYRETIARWPHGKWQ